MRLQWFDGGIALFFLLSLFYFYLFPPPLCVVLENYIVQSVMMLCQMTLGGAHIPTVKKIEMIEFKVQISNLDLRLLSLPGRLRIALQVRLDKMTTKCCKHGVGVSLRVVTNLARLSSQLHQI